MAEVAVIEIEVGKLPPWYLEDEGNHDVILESAIEAKWRSNPEYADADIHVSYNYSTDAAIVRAYDQTGNLVFERDNHDVSYAIDAAERYYI